VISGFTVINSDNGIYLNKSSPIIEDCVLENNRRGIHTFGSSHPIIRRCIVRDNSDKGGIFLNQAAVVMDCMIVGNYNSNGNEGGGITCKSQNPLILNCLIANNKSRVSGGGIYGAGSANVFGFTAPEVINCTIVNNIASDEEGGGVFAEDSLTMRNSIVWGNGAPGAFPDIFALEHDVSYSDIEGCWPGLGNIEVDPQFSDTLFHLTLDSPCIDAGNPLDDFNLEPSQNGGRINMGAYGNTAAAASGLDGQPIIESVSLMESLPQGGIQNTVNGQHFGVTAGSLFIGNQPVQQIINWTDNEIIFTVPAHDPGTVAVKVERADGAFDVLTYAFSYEGTRILRVPDSYAYIQKAINFSEDGDTVLVAPDTYSGSGNRELSLLGKSIVVTTEEGAEQTIIDAGGFGNGFQLNQDETNTSIISGFTVINSDNGIYLNKSSPIIEDCVLENNRRGIHTFGSSHPIIRRCIVRDNSDKGGIFLNQAAVVMDCMIVGNYNSNGNEGGGITCKSQNPLILNCLIANNKSRVSGGGIYGAGSANVFGFTAPEVINCTIVNNIANDEEGGGVFAEDSLTMRNSIVWGNQSCSTDFHNIVAPDHEVAYSDIEGGWSGEGNISQAPFFIGRFEEDHHLHPSSPCIDSGDPQDVFVNEPVPNGGRINMGAYGNTPEATSSATVPYIVEFGAEIGCASETQFSLSGANFGPSQGSSILKLNNYEVSTSEIQDWSDTLILATVPSGLLGFRDIVIVSSTGETDTFPAAYTYSPHIQYISGEISGTLTAACPSTYVVTGALTIPSGETLLIEPGVQILFHPDSISSCNNEIPKFTINGSLKAMGTADEPIIFSVVSQHQNPGTWKGLEVAWQETSSDTVILRHCQVQYAEIGLQIWRKNVFVGNSVFQHNLSHGIYYQSLAQFITGDVADCTISDNGGFGVHVYAETADGSATAEPEILRNKIYQNGQGGIKIEGWGTSASSGEPCSASGIASPKIIRNSIYDNQGFGIDCYAYGSENEGVICSGARRGHTLPIIEGNVVFNNQGGLRARASTEYSTCIPEVRNCTFYENGPTEVFAQNPLEVIIANSIFWVAADTSILVTEGSAQITISYSNFTSLQPGVGNISEPPLFFDPGNDDFRLLAASPGLDQGNNNEVNESIDFSGNSRIADGNGDGNPLVDMGAYEYHLPEITTEPIETIEVCEGENVLLSLSAEGDNLTYQWRLNGDDIIGAQSDQLSISNSAIIDNGIYTCAVTDELGGTVISNEAQLTVQPLLNVSLQINASDLVICENETVVFSADPENGGDSPIYQWLRNGIATGGNDSEWSYAGLQNDDVITCIMQSSENCVLNDTASSNQLIMMVNGLPEPEIVGAMEFCEGDSTMLTATGGLDYLWSTGDNTVSITVSTADDYTVTVTDGNGCTDTETVSVISNQLPTAEIDGDLEICDGESTTLTASGGTDYDWSIGDNTASITVSIADDYTVTVTDGNGCTDTKTVSVISNQLPTAEIDGNFEFCAGESTTLTASGGTDYDWSTGDNTVSITVSAADDYTVTVTDGNGCTDTETVSVISNQLPTAEIDGDLEICDGESTTLTASGGTDYDWSTGDNTVSITVSAADDYTVTVTDGNGCTDTETVSVISNQLPTAEIDGNFEFCDGESTTLTASGGTNYDWSTGDNTASITVSIADDYTVTVTDGNGCTDIETVSIIVNDLPSVELDLERDTFCINETDIELIGGTPNGGDYSGSGIMGNVFDPSSVGVGTHLITYTYEDGNGCMNSDFQEIVVEDGDCTTGTSSIEINKSVRVYPNPSNGNFSISLEDWMGRINIQVYDAQGRIIQGDDKESNRFEIENMPIGIYILKVSNNKYVAFKKLIIQ
jgi:parallel beta-helix repeat protein